MAAGAGVIALFVLLCCSCSCHGFFFIPERRHRSYLQGEEAHALVGPMATPLNMLPVDYYSLPSCKPTQGGPGSLARGGLGEMLLPDGTQSSPYRFRVNVNESLYLCTTDPLTTRDLDLLLKRKFQHYAVHMLLDDLPLASLDLDYSFKLMRGFFFSHMRVYPVDWVYIINHLKFRILLHEPDGDGVHTEEVKTASSTTRYEIVGFEVVPCSVARRSDEMSELNMYDNLDPPPDCRRWDIDAFAKARQGERVTFTYQVEYAISNISWSSRWDPYYLKVEPPHARSFAVLRSLATILILVVLYILGDLRANSRFGRPNCGTIMFIINHIHLCVVLSITVPIMRLFMMSLEECVRSQ